LSVAARWRLQTGGNSVEAPDCTGLFVHRSKTWGSTVMLQNHALRFLIVVCAVNGLICTVAPIIVLLRPDGPDEPVGRLIIAAAMIAASLTPVQCAALAVVLMPRVRALLVSRASRREIERVLRDASIRTVFQPIIDLQKGCVVGAEALTRFAEAPDRTSDMWFAAAHGVGYGLELEELALRSALIRAVGIPPSCYVALNASPSVLTSGRLIPLLEESGFPLDRVVVEITEHSSIADYKPVRAAREQLRERGVRVAVDDAGSGYASLRHVLELAPDLIKIDRSLISGVDADPVRGSMVAAVLMFALQSGASVVAEGVETVAELDVLRELGVEHAQGYLIARPSSDPHDWARWRAPLPTKPSGSRTSASSRRSSNRGSAAAPAA
jgi:EAL domain-containing protein (putative c-di-GMP-specific phosphodiesterase class I)